MDCPSTWLEYPENLLLKIICGGNMLKHIGTKDDIKITVPVRNMLSIILNDRPNTVISVIA
jgi:hypothetical protein